MTWRSTDRRVARRNCSTPRSSPGSARTTTTPDCGEITTLRPSPDPMIAVNAARSSAQKSFWVRVVMRLLSSPRVAPLAGVTDGVPGALAAPPATESVTEPDCTRTSDTPRREPSR